MAKASDLKRGSIVELKGVPHKVEDIQVQQPSARGGASLYKIRFRSYVTKQKEDGTYKGDDDFKDADVSRREVQFSYEQGDMLVFTDLSDYSEVSIQADDITEERQYLTDDLEGIHALISDDRVLGLELPDVVDLEITDCGPSIKGASATSRTKPATLSTGLTVQVPEYLERGEIIRVDTRTQKFLSRA